MCKHCTAGIINNNKILVFCVGIIIPILVVKKEKFNSLRRSVASVIQTWTEKFMNAINSC